MFVLSIRARKRQVLSTMVGICAVILIAVLALIIPAPSTASSADIPVVSTRAGTGEERLSFLKNLGYEAEETPTQVREIVLPNETDETMTKYNELQKQMGFDLEAYLGKRVKLYTYRLLNHKDANALAHLYIYRDTVIGGHVATANGDLPLI